ncbi:hypothetical membrane protein [Pelotomaculum thermopropionicum SI]|uniref:Hypothetical membrane protein n=1 Tax=Pelotomaculum thermopropionicum (strain DSM 13744 / JCM 10971 / SI) TaxID=370438 RepID=A5CYJ5_PELTS|nr:hypothetical membrane protein [Pelotomaculum thermopropionicum SI]
MRAKEGIVHVLYNWLVVGAAVWQLYLLFPALDVDRGEELLAVIFLGAMAEWLAVSFPHGQLSGGFALILTSFLLYGPAAAAWTGGLATLLGQGIANRGNPMRTTLFNAGQYVLAAVAAGKAFERCGGVPGLAGFANALPLAAFIASYITVNHVLVYLYLLPKRHILPGLAWTDAVKWDGLTYLFTVPLGLFMVVVYRHTGPAGVLPLFFSVLALQFILRYHVRLQVANRELTAFYEVARFLEGGPGPAEVLEQILKSAGKAFPFHTGVAYLRSEEKDIFLPAAVTGPYSKQLWSTAVYPDEGLIGWVLSGREPEIIYDSRSDPRTAGETGLVKVLRSLLVVPLLSGREALGVIVLGDKRPAAFEEKHLHIMAVLAGQAAVAVENAVLGARLEQALCQDPATGLLSFGPFSKMVREFCANAGPDGAGAGLILINLDHFRIFNQRYGREAGERVLAELAALIDGNTRKGDLAARYGGDEFALLLPGVNGRRLVEKAEIIWTRIRRNVFLKKEGRAARLTASIGVAEFPRDAGDAAGLFKAAERALKKAKEKGGDRVETAAVAIAD